MHAKITRKCKLTYNAHAGQGICLYVLDAIGELSTHNRMIVRLMKTTTGMSALAHDWVAAVGV